MQYYPWNTKLHCYIVSSEPDNGHPKEAYTHMDERDSHLPREQSSWGQQWAHLSLVGPRWAPCWPQEPCYQGSDGPTIIPLFDCFWKFLFKQHRISTKSIFHVLCGNFAMFAELCSWMATSALHHNTARNCLLINMCCLVSIYAVTCQIILKIQEFRLPTWLPKSQVARNLFIDLDLPEYSDLSTRQVNDWWVNRPGNEICAIVKSIN